VNRRVPLVTVIVPARDEAEDIEDCLRAIAGQDYPVNHLEVIVVDGCSTDGTADAARRALSRWGFASSAVVSNPTATASSNLNVGLARASGELICRVDARTRIQKHYVRTCVDLLTSRPEVAVVGGAQVAVARDGRAVSVGIARALNNRWSMGGSPYRRATASGPSDTVYLGSFRRAELVEEGGWDETLVSNQDFDLNRRMGKRGLVWFEASLRSGYLPRRSVGLLWRQYLRFGRAKVAYWRQTGERPEPRQWILLLGPPAAIAGSAAVAAAAGRSPVRALGLLATAALGAAAVEAKGAREPEGGLASHACAVVAMGVVSAGWWWGVVSSVAPVNRR
jgi:glycosyltransferase involved in cell wall biosynthesis